MTESADMGNEKISRNSALVIIDLQKGITGMPVEPYDATTVVKNAAMLARKFRENSMLVVPVHVSGPMEIMLHPEIDDQGQQFSRPERPSDWDEFVKDIEVSSSDLVITKHQWGAFYGTGLDMQLRRRKIDTLVMCGIATTYGVESTARFAYEYGYNQIFVRDAMSDRSKEAHEASIKFVLSRIGKIRNADEVLSML